MIGEFDENIYKKELSNLLWLVATYLAKVFEKSFSSCKQSTCLRKTIIRNIQMSKNDFLSVKIDQAEQEFLIR